MVLALISFDKRNRIILILKLKVRSKLFFPNDTNKVDITFVCSLFNTFFLIAHSKILKVDLKIKLAANEAEDLKKNK